METLIADAVQKGAEVRTGGKRIGNVGNFFEPTVMTGMTTEMRVMNEEPFGPLAAIAPFKGMEDLVEEANRLPYGWPATPSPARHRPPRRWRARSRRG